MRRALLLLGYTLGLFLIVGGFGYATRSTIAAGYHVGSWTLIAGVAAVFGVLILAFTLAVARDGRD